MCVCARARLREEFERITAEQIRQREEEPEIVSGLHGHGRDDKVVCTFVKHSSFASNIPVRR